jgi:Mucin-2 protein WxxW repeating region
MRKFSPFHVLVLATSCFSLSSMAVTTFKSAISPGDLAPIKRPYDQVAFENYVATCKTELEFDTIPQFDCTDINFRPPTNEPNFEDTNDFVAHRKVNDFVDSVFICRWVQEKLAGTDPAAKVDDILAATGEMIVHNRSNGNTCFFQLKTVNKTLVVNGALASSAPRVATTNPPSPTDSNAFQFWDSPGETVKTACTVCHSAGAYIASPQIADALAQYGLMNDGHDTKGEKYKAVGSLGATFNNYIAKTLDPNLTNCSKACHVTAGNKTVFDSELFAGRSISNAIIMPSLNYVIDEIISTHEMPPNHPFSPYRWINRDTPADAGDYERLSAVATEYAEIYKTCKTPQYMQAHEVDNTLMMETDDFVDTIDTFNLHDGLICLNADQATGRCNSYETRYRCNGKWTTWQSHDSPGSTGDHEKRSSYSFPATCTAPYAIQARYYIGDKAHIVNGPPDRLYQFDKNALVCRNKDQPTGERCHDYTVRFICP